MNAKALFVHHWSGTELSLTLVDQQLGPETYGGADYIYLLEKGETRAYLSLTGIEQAAQIGSVTLDPKKAEEIYAEGEKINQELLAYSCPKLTHENVLSEWKRLCALWKC